MSAQFIYVLAGLCSALQCGSSHCTSTAGEGAIIGTGFSRDHDNLSTSLCNGTMMESAFVSHGWWVNGIGAACNGGTGSIDFMVGSGGDRFDVACQGSGGIATITANTNNEGGHVSNMTIICADNTVDEGFGSKVDSSR